MIELWYNAFIIHIDLGCKMWFLGQVEKERRNNMEKCDFSIIAIRNSGEKKLDRKDFFTF